ncbi:MAG TPA: guanylate kinase [Bacteroidia bacterium]|jgi:guanylate kinase|nr:guanylate kinase [Bacteroidia bacterium]
MDGKLIIVAGPSGSGKTTIVRHLLGIYPRLAFSISACSRQKREGEMDGEDYYFLSIDQFKDKIEKGEFLEWEEVYPGSYYGTLRTEVERLWLAERDVIFDIDVKGAMNLKKHYPEQAITIFIHPPSIETLEERLQKRKTETPEFFEQRIKKAAEELSYSKQFDKIIYNSDLQTAFKEAEGLVGEFLMGNEVV